MDSDFGAGDEFQITESVGEIKTGLNYGLPANTILDPKKYNLMPPCDSSLTRWIFYAGASRKFLHPALQLAHPAGLW